MADIHGFNDIHRGVPLISRAVLTARLRELEDHGIIERRARTDAPATNTGSRPPAMRFAPWSARSASGGWCMPRPHQASDLDPSILMWGFFASAPIATRCRIGACRALRVLRCAGNAHQVPDHVASFRAHGVDVCAKDRALPSTW